MRRRAPARLLAVAALVTCGVAVYAIAHNELKSDAKGSSASTSTTTTRTTSTPKRTSSSGAKKGTYTVKSGDVLSAIAIKNGTSVAALEKLNPKMNAGTLRPGQKLKLPR